MNDKVDVAVMIEPLPPPGEPPIVYCLPANIHNLAEIVLRAYSLAEIIQLEEKLSEVLLEALEAHKAPTSPREIN